MGLNSFLKTISWFSKQVSQSPQFFCFIFLRNGTEVLELIYFSYLSTLEFDKN